MTTIKKFRFFILSLFLTIFKTANAEEFADFYQQLKLNEYLQTFGPLIHEGHMNKEQAFYFFEILKNNPNIKFIAEIGFNAGHSSELFLEAREDIVVVSFDLGRYESVRIAKDYIDAKYPKRHVLILGNSLKTVPKYFHENPNIKFDLIFIDGGHSYNVATNDLKNMKNLAHSDTILVMDDINLLTKHAHDIGPNRAWKDAIRRGIIQEVEKKIGSNGNKRWGRGFYLFSEN